MRSLYSDILATLAGNTFSIPNVVVRKPYDESPKSYPAIVVHEIGNLPMNHGTMNGETRTVLSYQFDILTQNCVDSDDNVLSRLDAGRLLVSEIVDLLSTSYKFTRRSIRHNTIAPDLLEHNLRGDCVLDSYGYSYRP